MPDHNFPITLAPIDFRHQGLILRGYQCRFDIAHFHDDLFDEFRIPMPNQLSDSVSKRKCEFLAGRICAERTLSTFGLSLHSRDIAIGKQGAPVWPAGISASISHTHDYALCVATASPLACGLGVDVEYMIDPSVAHEIQSHIIDSDENRCIRNHFASFHEGLTAAFSAKESIYKAFHSSVGQFFDFSAARICSISDSHFTFTVAPPLSDIVAPGRTLRVGYVIECNMVKTICVHRHTGDKRNHSSLA